MTGKRCIIRLPHSRKGWAAVVFVLLLPATILFCFLQHQATSQPNQRWMDAAQGLSSYDITLRLNPEDHTLAITEIIDYRNDTGETLDSLVLRTWLNAYQSEEYSPAATEEFYDACYPNGFSPGFLNLYDISWNGEQMPWAYLDDAQTALKISIPALADGKEGQLKIRCVAVIPQCAHRTGWTDAGYQLGNVLPVLSLYENGGWRAEEYWPIGDPFVGECANFSVTLYTPEGYIPACSAPLIQEKNGSWTGKILSARDIALCISPAYKTASSQVQGIWIHSFAQTDAGARRALGYARQAVEIFSALYGAYPYPSLTICSVDFPFGGMEYPGLCMLAENLYLESQKDTLELAVAHETAHQWFYALVGSDQYHQPWQDEAICEYAALRYVQECYGQGSFETLKYYRVDAPMQEWIAGNLTPGSPIDYFSNLNDYAAVVYGRGAALMLALDEMLPQGVDAFLRAYADHFAYQSVTRAEFEQFLTSYAGMDLVPLLLDYLDTAHSAHNAKERVIA